MSEPPIDDEEFDNADELFRTAELVMDSISTTFQEYSHDLPGRQYITSGGRGDTAHDCEQVTVSIEQIYSGLPGSQANEPQTCDGPTTVVFVVEVVRCIPTSNKNGKPPSPERMTATAKIQARDALLLKWAGLRAAETQNFTGGIADVMAGQPQGAYQAMIMNLIMPVFAGPGA